ncbi:MAG: type II toxin-antitoxin system VapC family toxin [Pyrinomonadaceae bacterium]|nr:type II toxin-antitoxin system VapC family toxin [Pyrinomonadaceae bacterium]
MKTNNGFWDSSALVPLCVKQATSQNFRQLWRQSTRVTVWSGATVEIRSALARLHRNNEIDAKGLQFTIKRLETMRRQWGEIVTGEKLRLIAEGLPDKYGLRALDSFQLAAALVWCKEAPKGRLFICDDARLVEAAQKVGFSVKP